jgi:16S rRNA processing protein RimM
MPENWVEVARLGRARGLRGEVYAYGWSSPGRYAPPFKVWLGNPDGSPANEGEPLVVSALTPYKDRLIVRFEGVESPEAARALAGRPVLLPGAGRPPLEAGEFYLSDLVGCEVVVQATGRRVGTVIGWREIGGPELLEVRPGGAGDQVIWIPFARAVCVEIDPAGRRIGIDPPEGLLELNG